MRNLFFWAFLLPVLASAQDLITPYEASHQTHTATYEECIAWYSRLAQAYPGRVQLLEVGTTDVGRPLHLVVLSKDGIASPGDLRVRSRTVLLINNGIHPGEPEGIDACMLLARDLASRPTTELLDETIVLIVPIYNVGGALNRGPYSRANQNGPEAYGFRGNRRNLDLNRDFVKQDSRNAQALARVFRDWQPHVFLDNHTTNGADYQPTMTLIATNRALYTPSQGAFFADTLVAGLYRDHEEAGQPMVPYVNTVAEVPDSGLVAFYDSPRYSTGYAALQNCLGLVAEAHMLKPYPQRVDATRLLMNLLLRHLGQHGLRIRALKTSADAHRPATRTLTWKLDVTRVDSVRFYGYTAAYKPSDVHGLERLYYDRSRPWAKNIAYYQTFVPQEQVRVPRAYVIPQAWGEVIARLQNAGVVFDTLRTDTTLTVVQYRLTQFQTRTRPYEGHYGHYEVKPEAFTALAPYYRGDLIAYTDQRAGRLLVELLEPHAVDSYFAWGFFDSILQQKEYFSDYVWEDRAAELLAQDPALRQAFEAAKTADAELAGSPAAQLRWLYDHSPHKEPTAYLYPIGRLEE